jgi:hypothetical protein
MTEAARIARNTERLAECAPTFAPRVQRILTTLQLQAFRPRIQDAFRSPADQRKAVEAGNSKLAFGFHNVTNRATGAKESLAVDVLDDDAPLDPSMRFLAALAIAASDVGCETGIAWGLPRGLQQAWREVIEARDVTRAASMTKRGWDPTHVQPRHLTVDAAKSGARPVPWPGGQP